MKNIQRKQIESHIQSLDIDLFNGHVDVILSNLNSLKDKYKEYKELKISITQSYEDTNIDLYGIRTETDAEYNARIVKLLKLEELKQKRAEAKLQKAKMEQIKAQAKSQEIKDLMKRFNVTTIEELRKIKNYISNLDV